MLGGHFTVPQQLIVGPPSYRLVGSYKPSNKVRMPKRREVPFGRALSGSQAINGRTPDPALARPRVRIPPGVSPPDFEHEMNLTTKSNGDKFFIANGHSIVNTDFRPMNTVSFGQRLANRRKELGLSQTQVARKIQTPPTAISHWECGRRLPSMERLTDLCVALRCSSDQLLGLPRFL